MASSLAKQLSQIRVKGTNPLDLKQQKKAHSQSLLFDSKVAATQDFETIFSICHEGFHDLCLLDTRFSGFAEILFSEQSKREDRAQMTISQNLQLDQVLEFFLDLVADKLPLKPALKAVEWLVRRFRIHEKNTSIFAMTFLPYHTTPLFVKMLSILPHNLPPSLGFLRPYVRSLTNPPRHVVIHVAANDLQFLDIANIHVLKAGQSRYHNPVVSSFWITTITEAVTISLDQSRSGSKVIESNNQREIILRIMPFLNKVLTSKGLPILKTGCYMILIVLASKVELQDTVLASAMEAVASSWSHTIRAGLICLAALAQKREHLVLPSKVLSALLAIETLENDLTMLQTQYDMSKIAVGVLLGIILEIRKSWNTARSSLFFSMMLSNLVEKAHKTTVIKIVLSALQKSAEEVDTRDTLINIIVQLAKNESNKLVIGENLETSDVSRFIMDKGLLKILQKSPSPASSMKKDIESVDQYPIADREDFEMVVGQIPAYEASKGSRFSFFSDSNSYLFDKLATAFLSAISSDNIIRFLELPSLGKRFAMESPHFLTFFVRFWCGNYPTHARCKAIAIIHDWLTTESEIADVQFMLPYVVFGLADGALPIRQSMVKLVMSLDLAYQNTHKIQGSSQNQITGIENLYDDDPNGGKVTWLPIQTVSLTIRELLVPCLEECLLDSTYILNYLSEELGDVNRSLVPPIGKKVLKSSFKSSVFGFFCIHVVKTPIFSMKLRLLQSLNRVEKAGGLSRTKALLPLLSQSTNLSQDFLLTICHKWQIDLQTFLRQLIAVVSPSHRDGICTIQKFLGSEDWQKSPGVLQVAHQRIREIWPKIKPDQQLSLAETLLGLAAEDRRFENDNFQRVEALDTLRTASLSIEILQSLLESCFCGGEDSIEGPSVKRRRTSPTANNTTYISLSPRDSGNFIKKISVILDLIGTCRLQWHPTLMRWLFQVLVELQTQKTYSYNRVDYLQVLTIDNVSAIIEAYKLLPNGHMDSSIIQLDVLIDSMRIKASPQLQQAALLLISNLATIIPELVLHSVMPVFTCMGERMLQQNDEYSVYVIQQTVESVVPRLIESFQKRKEDPIFIASELLLSFVAAFQHIPSHRRLRLFKVLIDRLGAADFLFALLILLQDRYPNDNEVVQFATKLTNLYDIQTHLTTIENYLGVLTDILKPEPTVSQHLIRLTNEWSAGSAIANLLPLLAAILKSKGLVSKKDEIFGPRTGNTDDFKSQFARILEQILAFSASIKSNSNLRVQCHRLLASLNDLLSLQEFIDVLQSLLLRAEDEIRCQLIISFEQRLNLNSSQYQDAQSACLTFLKQLTSVLKASTNMPLKRATLAAINLLVEKFGRAQMASILPTAVAVADNEILGSTDSKLRIASILCLTTLLEVLEDSFVPLIPSVFPTILAFLRDSIRDEVDDHILHDAAYTFFLALLNHIPWIIKGAYLEQIVEASHDSANSNMGNKCDQTRFQTLKLIATQVDLQDCITVLDKSWKNAMSEGPLAVKEHIQMLRLAVEQHSKSMISKHADSLFNLILKVYDFRLIQFCPRSEDSFEDGEVESAERDFIDVVISVIYKLNDVTFRPMFLRMYQWATDITLTKNRALMFRQTTLYNFLVKFFDKLKSIVTNYAGLIIDGTVAILQEIDLRDDDARLLWTTVIATLSKCFENDQDDFWQIPDHFHPICTALLNQFPHAPSIQSTLIPALTALAAAADSPSHRKHLNAALLQFLRSDRASIRLAAVQCQQSLTARLGDEWLGLLPEMLPFISEALEDDNEGVERELRRWVANIEEILGENLSDMLQ